MPAPMNPVTPGRVTDHEPRVVIETHPGQQVTGEDLLLDNDLFAVLELDDILERNDDLEEPLLHVHGLGAGQQVIANLVLVAGLRVDHVPPTGPVVR